MNSEQEHVQMREVHWLILACTAQTGLICCRQQIIVKRYVMFTKETTKQLNLETKMS
jgi:hypothetical protein